MNPEGQHRFELLRAIAPLEGVASATLALAIWIRGGADAFSIVAGLAVLVAGLALAALCSAVAAIGRRDTDRAPAAPID